MTDDLHRRILIRRLDHARSECIVTGIIVAFWLFFVIVSADPVCMIWLVVSLAMFGAMLRGYDRRAQGMRDEGMLSQNWTWGQPL